MSGEINSREWWDKYFLEHWSANDGMNQTRYFMRQVLLHLPDSELGFLLSGEWGILDWGCAFGEGVSILGEALPGSRVAGLDFSIKAIETASEEYPSYEFIHTPDGSIPRMFDVIVTSNCLEHFDRPFDTALQHVAACRRLYLALVPYEEEHLHEQHRARFTDSIFPSHIGEFARLATVPFDSDPLFWPGKQVLAVYGSPTYLQEQTSKWDASINERIDRVRREQVLLAAKERLESLVARHEHYIQVQDARIADLVAAQTEAEAKITKVETKIHEAESVARSIEAKAAQQARQLRVQTTLLKWAKVERDALDTSLRATNGQFVNVHAELGFYLGTKAVRLTNMYWEMRRNGLRWWGENWRRLLHLVARSAYHTLVPRRSRLAFYNLRHKEMLAKAQAEQDAVALRHRQYNDDLRAILERHADARGIVIVLPGIEWHMPLFQRPQQMSLAFAAEGYLVLYCVYPGGPDQVDGFREVASGVYLCNVPASVLATISEPVVISYSYNDQHADQLTNPVLVYEYIDRLEIFTSFDLADLIAKHRRLLRDADVVVATANDLLDEVRVSRPDAILCPNGVDYAHFEPTAPGLEQVPDELQTLIDEHISIVGYYGALAEWFDYDLMNHVARALPECTFVLIGPSHDGSLERSGLTSLPNVRWLGPKKYEELPRYLHAFSVAIIPFKTTDEMQAVSPLKLFEYMAGQRPVVTTDLAECRQYPVVYAAKTADEFASMIHTVLDHDLDRARYCDDLRETALENTWTSRARQILSAIAEKRPSAVDAVGKLAQQERTNTYDVIRFPVINWNFRYQRPQHLLAELARRGSRTFYANIDFVGMEHDTVGLKRLDDSIYEMSLPGNPDTVIYRDAMDADTLDRCITALRRFARRYEVVEAVCIVDHPFWTPLALALKSSFGWRVVYDCMDDHSGFGNNTDSVLGNELRLIQESDLLITSSALLEERFGRIHGNSVLVRNAADYEHFGAKSLRSAESIAELPRPVIGYYGAIAEWFDAPAVIAAATRHPEWSFVLIGHTFGADLGELPDLANVHFLGEKPYNDLPGYLAAFDVCMIPFRRIPLTEATNPVKLYEFLSAGKTVVARRLPELEPFDRLVHLYETHEEFVTKLEAAIKPADSDEVEKRREVARANTWQVRGDVLEASLRGLYGRASIIIVTYNNLELTRLTLESVLTKTLYPNFEVIVVDNASDASVIDYLGSVAAQHPNVKVLLNARNTGFAAANNAGIQAAAGSEYIVLLNNDVIVTTGWLSRMLRHLQNADVGMVGPVTNNIANEARIDVPYSSIQDIEGFARSRHVEHEGRSFDIRVLAMYCVVMRKDVVDRIGPLDERFEIGMFEDDDYSLRMHEAGYRLICAEDVFVHHFGRSSFKLLGEDEYMRIFEANKRLFEAKWELHWQQHSERSSVSVSVSSDEA